MTDLLLKFAIFFWAWFQLLLVIDSSCDEGPIVNMPLGQLRGCHKMTYKRKEYYSYEGVPFALPPVGSLRFRDPLPPAPWKGVLNASAPKPVCLQETFYERKEPIGSEDCLYLNIYSPIRHNEKEKLPVLFVVYGGAFVEGSSTRNNPELFLEADVVVVSISYRVGVLGFLCLDTPEVPGNAGMKDAVLALRWVKEYIGHFGGDLDKIILFGYSSASASVHFLQISPMSKNLARSAIIISGSGLSGWAIQDSPMKIASEFLDLFHLKFGMKGLLNTLQRYNGSDIVKAGNTVHLKYMNYTQFLAFSPVIEKKNLSTEQFLDRDPTDSTDEANIIQTNTLIGYSSIEYMFFSMLNYPYPVKVMIKEPFFVVPNRYTKMLPKKCIKAIYNDIIHFFFGNNTIDIQNNDHMESALYLFSDLTFIKALRDFVEFTANRSKASIYFYRFSFNGILSRGHEYMDRVGVQGSGHDGDMSYLFPRESERQSEFTAAGTVRRRHLRLVTNFMRFGNPTPEYSNLIPTKWLPVTKDAVNYMEINGQMTPSINPDDRRTIFWRNLDKKVLAGHYC